MDPVRTQSTARLQWRRLSEVHATRWLGAASVFTDRRRHRLKVFPRLSIRHTVQAAPSCTSTTAGVVLHLLMLVGTQSVCTPMRCTCKLPRIERLQLLLLLLLDRLDVILHLLLESKLCLSLSLCLCLCLCMDIGILRPNSQCIWVHCIATSVAVSICLRQSLVRAMAGTCSGARSGHWPSTTNGVGSLHLLLLLLGCQSIGGGCSTTRTSISVA